jgi:hypothetical protein
MEARPDDDSRFMTNISLTNNRTGRRDKEKESFKELMALNVVSGRRQKVTEGLLTVRL